MQNTKIILNNLGQQQQKNQKLQVKAYYYQQEQTTHLVKWEYMIWQEMFLNGH